FLFLLVGCDSSDDSNSNRAPLAAQDIMNVSYGSNAEQKMDVYLPAGRTENTKVIVLVHGGSWIEGSKNDLSPLVPVIKQQFPDHAIVNIDYRLATQESPAYPKQIDDIEAVLDYLDDSDYNISDDYGFIGFSAGAHLSMLYAYAHDDDRDIKAICNVVGPADFTDQAYLDHPLYPYAASALVGTPTPTAAMIMQVNPAAFITSQSAPTISFYGGQDPLVPSSQGPRLKAKLDAAGVYNEYNFYPDGGHADWDPLIMQEVYAKITTFLRARL
ncbi:MAG: alpha/beta hydrolase, partial [Flavobacterium sp.]